jgi:raffinose/stachyose/melibiose transport system permease protein
VISEIIKKKFLDTAGQILLIAQTIIVIYPLFIMVSTSLKSNQEIFNNPLGFPKKILVSGYLELIKTSNFSIYFVNSIIVTILSLAFVITIAIMLSYAISRYTYKVVGYLYMFVLLGMMIPIRLGILNLTEILKLLNLLDRLSGLIIVYTAMTIPFSMFIISGFIRQIPLDLEEAAYIDGCSIFGIITRIIIPMLRPAIATTAVYNFIQIWNDVYFPLILIRDEYKKTLSLGITMFFGQYSTNWNLAFSALTISALPTLVFYFFVSKHLVKGLTAGAIKG